MRREDRRREAVREYMALSANDREMRCWALAASLPANGPASETPQFVRLVRRDGVTSCASILLGSMAPGAKDIAGVPPLRTLLRRAVLDAGEVSLPWLALANTLALQGDSAGAEQAMNEAMVKVLHPLDRLEVLVWRAWFAGVRGRADESEARWQAIEAAVARDGRAAMRLALYNAYRSFASPATRPHDKTITDTELARASRGIRAGQLLSQAFVATNKGDFAAAIPWFERGLVVSDSGRDGQNGVVARLAMGRVLSKMGRLADAERTLMRAYRDAAGSNQRYTLAEIWHNLAHTYEGQRATTRALAASDSFVAYASRLEHDPIRIISRHDAGLLRLTLGMHAAAHVHFEAMVRLIDAERQNHYWAGEYYERIGNPRSAQMFYARGVLHDPGERSLNYAGLARVYAALGLPDSAALAARLHDAAHPTPTDVPLEAEVLARSGRLHEAADIARRAAIAREQSRNVQGTALAWLQVARLELDATDPRAAVADLDRADAHIAALSLRVERIEALRLRGRAALMTGDATGARAHLQDASRLARQAGDSRLIRDVEIALGRTLAASNDEAGALRAFDRAATLVSSATATFSDDVDRARYRASHMEPFDAAVRVALRQKNAASLVPRWSSRRKAAALTLASHSAVNADVDVRALRRSLDATEAIVDYQVLPEQSAAVVIRRDTVRVIALPLSGDSLTAMAARLTVGFRARGRSVDLRRARFDLPTSHALYRALVAPLSGALDGVKRVVVIPDGPVYHVPFAALATTAGAGARFLVEDRELDYALSLSTIGRSTRWSGVPLTFVWTDVPGVDAERSSVKSSWPNGAFHELGGTLATETAVASLSRGPGVLHFAVHAEASDQNPFATHLQLNGDAMSDGLLHLGEIGGAPLAGKLVVLAACESLVGPLVAGEGFMGLARAFVGSGAAGVVATRWPVDATSARFSAQFYRSLANGASPGAATRTAQLALLRDPATANPFYWAAYGVISGASR